MGTQRYADAAVLGYTGAPPAIRAGAETLHVIYVDPDVNVLSEKRAGSLDTLYRMFLKSKLGELKAERSCEIGEAQP